MFYHLLFGCFIVYYFIFLLLLILFGFIILLFYHLLFGCFYYVLFIFFHQFFNFIILLFYHLLLYSFGIYYFIIYNMVVLSFHYCVIILLFIVGFHSMRWSPYGLLTDSTGIWTCLSFHKKSGEMCI